MSNEDRIRHLVAALREAFENGDDAAVEEMIHQLEAAAAEAKAPSAPGDD